MKVTLDMPYSAEFQPTRRFDLFLPEGNANGSAVFFIHGGGWSGGCKEQWHSTALHFCNRGYACASAGYRLAPEWKFRDQVEDLRLAMSVFRSRAQELGFSPSGIAALGSSAGGHLVAMLATIDAEDSLGRCEEMPLADTRPNAAVCYCAVTTVRESAREPIIPKSVLDLMGKRESEDPALYAEASPQDRVSGREPPFLFVHGDADTTVPPQFSIDMAERIREAGGIAEVVLLPGVAHGFGYGVLSDAQRQSVGHVEAFLERRGANA